MRLHVFITLPLLLLVAHVHAQTQSAPLPDGLYAEVTTPRGIIIGELYYQRVPMTVANYVGLAEGTLGPQPRKPFFDTTTFHRVVPNFVVQGGSPTPDGEGDAGYKFPDEIVPGLRHDSLGVMQMANDGPDTNGSQWCFMLGEFNRLNYNHTVFGHVVRGEEVLPRIQQGDTMKVRILRIGDEAKAFKADETAFKALAAKAKPYTGPKAPAPDAFFDDPDKLLPTEWSRAATFNFKLANVERFTGIRIVARLLAQPPEGQSIDAYLTTLADKMKTGDTGAVALYIAQNDQWYFHFGKAAEASFIAGPREKNGTKKPLPPNSIEVSLREFLTSSRAQSARVIAAAEKAATTQPVANTQKLKLQVDAVLDNLIFRLEPEPSARP